MTVFSVRCADPSMRLPTPGAETPPRWIAAFTSPLTTAPPPPGGAGGAESQRPPRETGRLSGPGRALALHSLTFAFHEAGQVNPLPPGCWARDIRRGGEAPVTPHARRTRRSVPHGSWANTGARAPFACLRFGKHCSPSPPARGSSLGCVHLLWAADFGTEGSHGGAAAAATC